MIVTNNVKSSTRSNKRELIQQPNYRKKYYFTKYNLLVPSPVFSILEQNKNFLLETADLKTLDSKYHGRPDLFCSDTYHDPGLYFVILFVNDMFSMMDFITDSIMVPTATRMMTVLRETEARTAFADIKKPVEI